MRDTSEEKSPGITESYEQKVLDAFKIWYWQQAQPTIDEAATQSGLIARDAVRGLTTDQVIALLEEHSEWTHQPPPVHYESDQQNITIGEMARRHFIKHLQKAIQKKGLQAAYREGQQ